MNILITGGAGFIGSHAIVALHEKGYNVFVVDNFSNSSPLALDRVSSITGKVIPLFQGDVRDKNFIKDVLTENQIDGVIHFAGLKSVDDSLTKPLTYYDNNVSGTIALCSAMAEASIFRLVFSSSATVYGASKKMPVEENFPLGSPTNPYGQSKLIVEKILKDLVASQPQWSISILRYFNPVGAHDSGLIGENPIGKPNNLFPYITQVAIGRLKELSVFGNDYATPDGTGIRDYIHVMDLAEGHVKAIDFIANQQGLGIWNLGTGRGLSVLNMINAFETACGCKIPFKIAPRRDGDIAMCWADPSKAYRELGWKAERNINDMVNDAWRWQKKNPEGYE